MNNLVAIAEALKGKVRDVLNQAIVGDPLFVNAEVSRVWDVMFQTPEQVQTIDDRRVYILPLDKEFQDAADRETDQNAYRFGIVVADRIPGDLLAIAAEPQLTAWIDEAVEWVEQIVLTPLSDTDYSPIPNAYLSMLDWREVVRRGISRTLGIFWSEIDIEFSIDEVN